MEYADLSDDVKAEFEAMSTLSWDDYVELLWQQEQENNDGDRTVH